jgi:hypothetical protein
VPDALDRRRVVQRRQPGQRLDLGQHVVVDHDGLRESIPPVHDAMTDGHQGFAADAVGLEVGMETVERALEPGLVETFRVAGHRNDAVPGVDRLVLE